MWLMPFATTIKRWLAGDLVWVVRGTAYYRAVLVRHKRHVLSKNVYNMIKQRDITSNGRGDLFHGLRKISSEHFDNWKLHTPQIASKSHRFYFNFAGKHQWPLTNNSWKLQTLTIHNFSLNLPNDPVTIITLRERKSRKVIHRRYSTSIK